MLLKLKTNVDGESQRSFFNFTLKIKKKCK
jgi:hypothetical protein